MNNFKKDVSKLYPLETRFSKKTIACAITLSLGMSAIPLSSFAAALLQGQRFIDTSNDGVLNNNESIYTTDGYILFRPLNSPNLSVFSTPIIGGGYSTFLADGKYKVWQNVDAALLPPSQLSSIRWANESDSLQITVSGNIIRWTDTDVPVPNNTINFPFLNLSDPIPLTTISTIASACNINNSLNREIICGTGAVSLPNGLSCNTIFTSGNSWASSNINKRIFIYGDVTASATQISVGSLCNYGTLTSNLDGSDLKLKFQNVLANYGSIIGVNAPTSTMNGASIQLQGSNSGTGGIVSNQGTIKAGNAFTLSIDQNQATEFTQSISTGGNVLISAGSTYQYGYLSAGQGSEIRFSDFWAAWHWEHNAGDAIWGDNNSSINLSTPSSKGGNVTIAGGTLVLGGNSFSSGGKGGSIIIELNDDCGNNPTQQPGWCINEIEGGKGGNLDFLTSSVIANSGESGISTSTIALSGNSVYVEPDTTELSGNTTISANENVVIFGGDEHIIKIMNLAANAITAGRKIILATGTGGTIDLRGTNGKIFKAGDKVEIYTDNLLLDAGVTLESLVDAPNGVIRSGAKIIYHATITGSSQLNAKAGETINAQLDLRNASPKQDSYVLKAVTHDGVVLNGLPTNLTIDGLKSAPLNLSIAVPSTISTESTSITITATSQTDPTVVATFELRLNVPQINCNAPAIYDTSTRLVTLPKIDVPLLSPIDGKPTGEIAVFSGQLEQVPGVEDFKIKPDSLKFLNFSTTYDPSHARYNFNTGLFSNGGLLKTCVAVPRIIVIPPNTPIYTDPKHYFVTLRQLAVSPDTFHVESVDPANP